MSFPVREKAEYVGTFRWIEVYLMETLASWVPTTPEMEIKVLFGRHVWETAQNADGLGKRAFELRAPLHFSLPPEDGFRKVLEEVRGMRETNSRITAFYDAVLPELSRRYQQYLDRTDTLLDEPTVRVIERILSGHQRMLRERKEYSAYVASLPGADPAIQKQYAQRFSSLATFVCHGTGDTLARPVHA